jgi:putative redox protein
MAIRVHLKRTDGLQFVARSGNGPAVVIDSSEGGSGASPMQLLLMGIAGCTAIDIAVIIEKKRVRMSRFEIMITGNQAEDHPKRYTKISIEYLIYGKGIKPGAVEQAIELSQKKYCSAMASLNAEFEHSYQIIEEGGK